MTGSRAFYLMMLGWVASGCGPTDAWGPVPVTGKVTYEDETVIPVRSMRLSFIPQAAPLDEKTHPRQGHAGVDVSDGSFGSPTTYRAYDGLIPGRHKVVIAAYDEGRGLSPKVPAEYASVTTTPIEIHTDQSPLHIKIRKP